MEARVRENGKVIGRVSGIEKESLFTERERAGYCPLRRMHRRIKGFCAMDERWWRRNNALFRPLPIFLPSSHTCPHRTQIFLPSSPEPHIYSLSENRFDSCLANESTFPPNRQNKSTPSHNRRMIS